MFTERWYPPRYVDYDKIKLRINDYQPALRSLTPEPLQECLHYDHVQQLLRSVPPGTDRALQVFRFLLQALLDAYDLIRGYSHHADDQTPDHRLSHGMGRARIERFITALSPFGSEPILAQYLVVLRSLRRAEEAIESLHGTQKPSRSGFQSDSVKQAVQRLALVNPTSVLCLDRAGETAGPENAVSFILLSSAHGFGSSKSTISCAYEFERTGRHGTKVKSVMVLLCRLDVSQTCTPFGLVVFLTEEVGTKVGLQWKHSLGVISQHVPMPTSALLVQPLQPSGGFKIDGSDPSFELVMEICEVTLLSLGPVKLQEGNVLHDLELHPPELPLFLAAILAHRAVLADAPAMMRAYLGGEDGINDAIRQCISDLDGRPARIPFRKRSDAPRGVPVLASTLPIRTRLWDPPALRHIDDLRRSESAWSRAQAATSQSSAEQADLQRLAPGVWVNNFALEVYGELLCRRLRADKGLKAVHHCSYPDSKPASVQHDTVLLLHTHLENSHWSATATDLERKLIHVYDSKGIRLSRVNPTLRIIKEITNGYRPHEWSVIQHSDSPQQPNEYDCGIFAAMSLVVMACHASEPSPIRDWGWTAREGPFLRGLMILELAHQFIDWPLHGL